MTNSMPGLQSLSNVEQAELEALIEKRWRRQARQSLLSFAQYTKRDYLSAPHLQLLAEALERVERGECKRLIVVMPPRHGKSELISIRFPCWYLAKHPYDRIVQAGYAESISLVHSRQARDVFAGPEFHALFPDVHHRPERAGQEAVLVQRQAAHEWGTIQGGSYYAVGIGGGLTGRGFDLGIIDDPIKDAEEAQSEMIREKVWEWYRTVFRTRCQPDAAIVVMMTRWNEDDLVGKLLDQQRTDPDADQWEVLHLPAIDENGDALWPERYPIEALQSIRATIGGRNFTALYQGSPAAAEGNIFKREWWQYYREAPAQFEKRVWSWDTAFKKGAENDYSVGLLWGVAQNGYYLLDCFREKVEYPELKRAVTSAYARDTTTAVLIEDKASGQSLIQELRRNTNIPLLPIKVDSDKVARANAVTPIMESGRVYLPENAPWLYDYIEELSAFPNAKHDDQVDATTQFLNWATHREPEDEEQIVIYDAMQLVGSVDL